MATTNGNGTIGDKTKFTLTTVVLIIGVAFSAAAFGWAIQTGLAAHCGNDDIHHSTQALEAKFVQEPVMQGRLDEVMRRLDRIEGKLDKLQ